MQMQGNGSLPAGSPVGTEAADGQPTSKSPDSKAAAELVNGSVHARVQTGCYHVVLDHVDVVYGVDQARNVWLLCMPDGASNIDKDPL